MYSYLTSGLQWPTDERGVKRMCTTSVLRLVLALFVAVFPSLAQQITGSITGAVTDPTGAAVTGAAVKLTNTETGAIQNSASDESGNFRFLLLPPGNYSLQVTT